MTRIPVLYRCGVCPTGLYLPPSSCLRWQLVDGGGGDGGGGERAMRSRGMHKTEMPSIFRYRGVYRGLSPSPSLFLSRVDRYTDTDIGVPITGLRFKGDSNLERGGLVARYRRSLPGYKLIGLLCNRGSHVTVGNRAATRIDRRCALCLCQITSKSCFGPKCPFRTSYQNHQILKLFHV